MINQKLYIVWCVGSYVCQNDLHGYSAAFRNR